MAYFEWADDMEIDGGVIDADHRVLVELVNELHSATSRGAGREVVGGILHRTIQTTHDHLRREEALMAEKGFPDLDKHKIGHDHFMRQLYTLQERLDSGYITVAAQLSSVLRDWLSLHIRRNDKKLRKFEQNLIRDRERQAVAQRLAERAQRMGLKSYKSNP